MAPVERRPPDSIEALYERMEGQFGLIAVQITNLAATVDRSLSQLSATTAKQDERLDGHDRIVLAMIPSIPDMVHKHDTDIRKIQDERLVERARMAAISLLAGSVAAILIPVIGNVISHFLQVKP